MAGAPGDLTLAGLLANPRRWCETIAPGLPRETIERHGRPYLDRYFVAGWRPKLSPGPGLFLHHFLASDSQGVYHSHPWVWSASLILAGGYTEHRCRGHGVIASRVYHAGEVNVLLPDDRHRIELLEADCWSLFLAGEFARPWAFGPCEK